MSQCMQAIHTLDPPVPLPLPLNEPSEVPPCLCPGDHPSSRRLGGGTHFGAGLQDLTVLMIDGTALVDTETNVLLVRSQSR